MLDKNATYKTYRHRVITFIEYTVIYVSIHMLDEYGMVDTVLGNLEWNSKLIYDYDFTGIKKTQLKIWVRKSVITIARK